MFKHALVTTDGSPLSQAAITYVAQVVDPAGTVTVLQVIDDASRLVAKTSAGFEFAMSNAVGINVVDEIVAGERLAANINLGASRRHMEAAGLREIETIVRQGIPGEVIVQEALDLHVDVVVMATHGRGGLRRTVLGSVTDHVVRHLEGIPVLLIHPHHEAELAVEA